jgi:hypothetical protein
VYLLDAQLQPVPIGVAGDLYIGGAGLARGYLGRPDLTAEKFIPNPFADAGDKETRRQGDKEGVSHLVTLSPPHLVTEGGYRLSAIGYRLYRTGDRARWHADGTLEFLGRRDQQIKLRGFRIELGEIAAVLRQHPAVQEAVVVLRADTTPASGYPEQRLVAYVVQGSEVRDQGSGAAPVERLTPDPRPLIAELRAFLKTALPEYMLPSGYVVLAQLPLNAHGKLDRRALPPPRIDDAARPIRPPRTPIEELLATIWATVLRLERVGIDDDFFALGGHSLSATQVLARIQTGLRVALPVRQLFETPTIAALAPHVEAACRSAGAGASIPAIPRADRAAGLPLSFAQQRLWFLDQLSPANPVYNIPLTIRLTGELAVATLAHSLRALVARHESLRTSFATVKGAPTQVITPIVIQQLPLIDLSELAEGARQVQLQYLLHAEVMRPFDLARGPLLRTTLLRLDPTEHVLQLTLHHIIADGWSLDVLLHELITVYRAASSGQPPALPELPLQYADYAVWQRQWLHGAVLAEQLAYWSERLADAPTALALPIDFARPPVPSFRGTSQDFLLPTALSQAINALSREAGTTLFMTMLAAFQVLLARYSGQDSLLIGIPSANRSHPDLEGVVGCFVNTLVLHGDLSGNPSFRELLTRVRESCLEAYTRQDLPFEQLVAHLQPQRDLRRTPLVQVMFDVRNSALAPSELPGLILQLQTVPMEIAKFDLILNIEETAQGLHGLLEYNTDLFEDSTITGMRNHFRSLLDQIIADPDQRLADLLPTLKSAVARPPSAPSEPEILLGASDEPAEPSASEPSQSSIRKEQLSEIKRTLLEKRLRSAKRSSG